MVDRESIEAPSLVSMRSSSSCSIDIRCASSQTSTTRRPRSSSSAAKAAWACGIKEALWKRGFLPRAVTIAA